ncbi:MAG: hypothetical protein HGB21_04890 [Nitrospirae bacterium]|nr:hypothetical protein [Nitrospirota bacterium]
MKKRIPLVGTLVIVLSVFVTIGGGIALAQTAEPPAPAGKVEELSVQPSQPEAQPEQAAPVVKPGEPLNTANKLRLQLEGFFGYGFDSNKVGTTTEGNDVKISAGGGFGYGATIGYGLSRSVDIDGTLGFQVSGLYPYVKNADGYFARSLLLATVKYKIPFRENLQWKVGVGAGYYMGGKMDIEIDPGVPGAGHYIYDYQNATGIHATGELEIALQRNLMLAVGLKYYMVEYKVEKATQNGVPVTVPSEFRTLTGDGVDITVGIAVLF